MKRALFLLVLALALISACTIKIDPVIEVQDASVQIGPIQVCYDAGSQ